jgi:hydrogenase-4 component F
MLSLFIIGLPVAAVLVTLGLGWGPSTPWVGVVADAIVLTIGFAAALHDVGHRAHSTVGGNLRIDSLSAFMVIVIGIVSLLASWGSVRY